MFESMQQARVNILNEHIKSNSPVTNVDTVVWFILSNLFDKDTLLTFDIDEYAFGKEIPRFSADADLRRFYYEFNKGKHWTDEQTPTLLDCLILDFIKSGNSDRIKFVVERIYKDKQAAITSLVYYLLETEYVRFDLESSIKYVLYDLLEDYKEETVQALNGMFIEQMDINMVLLLLNRYKDSFIPSAEFLYAVCHPNCQSAFIEYYPMYEGEDLDIARCMGSCFYYEQVNEEVLNFILSSVGGNINADDFVIFALNNEKYVLQNLDKFSRFYPLDPQVIGELLFQSHPGFYETNMGSIFRIIEASDRVKPFDLKVFSDGFDLIIDPNFSRITLVNEVLTVNNLMLRLPKNKIASWKFNFMITINLSKV